jgi:uncharacterized protein YgfB (UPF0149 family)
MSAPLDYAGLSTLMARVGYGDEPSSFHGTLVGALCRQKPHDVDPADLLDDEEARPDAQGQLDLRALREQVLAALNDLESVFTPMLPADESPLGVRARALGAWCEGFLYGLAGRIHLNLREVSEEVRDVVKDFTEFTRASLDPDGDPEVEETAYTELVEYVRVGAQLVYMELHPRPDAVIASSTIH